jgi:hypothetical protein
VAEQQRVEVGLQGLERPAELAAEAANGVEERTDSSKIKQI